MNAFQFEYLAAPGPQGPGMALFWFGAFSGQGGFTRRGFS
jgi:hypothetical protein